MSLESRFRFRSRGVPTSIFIVAPGQNTVVSKYYLAHAYYIWVDEMQIFRDTNNPRLQERKQKKSPENRRSKKKFRKLPKIKNFRKLPKITQKIHISEIRKKRYFRSNFSVFARKFIFDRPRKRILRGCVEYF